MEDPLAAVVHAAEEGYGELRWVGDHLVLEDSFLEEAHSSSGDRPSGGPGVRGHLGTTFRGQRSVDDLEGRQRH